MGAGSTDSGCAVCSRLSTPRLKLRRKTHRGRQSNPLTPAERHFPSFEQGEWLGRTLAWRGRWNHTARVCPEKTALQLFSPDPVGPQPASYSGQFFPIFSLCSSSCPYQIFGGSLHASVNTVRGFSVYRVVQLHSENACVLGQSHPLARVSIVQSLPSTSSVQRTMFLSLLWDLRASE